MLTVNLLEPRDWSSGQVPDSVEHISSMDPIVVCRVKARQEWQCQLEHSEKSDLVTNLA